MTPGFNSENLNSYKSVYIFYKVGFFMEWAKIFEYIIYKISF